MGRYINFMLHMGRTSASLSFINGIDCMPYQAALSVVNERYIYVFPCLKRFCLKRRIHQQKCVQICIEGKVWNMFLKEGEKNGNGIYFFLFFSFTYSILSFTRRGGVFRRLLPILFLLNIIKFWFRFRNYQWRFLLSCRQSYTSS